MAKSKILLVEDEKVMREGYTTVLERGGYEVFTAKDGEEGIKKVPEANPDLIILDILMPKMDGFDFLIKYNAELKDKHPNTLIIVYSNFSNPEIIQRAAKLGVAEYFVKAVTSPSDMLRIVKEILSGK